MKTRKETEEELQVTLTALVENSRANLLREIGEVMQNETQELRAQTALLIDFDCDDKLTMIPKVIKCMLDQADKNAQRNADEIMS